MIKDQDAGEKTADLRRRYGFNQGVVCKYKSGYDGREPSDA
ncbi:hypothetical protein [Phaeobacter sp. B1627]|nr:hypothetical protein [Phaeobacter sp. B1627]